jgi:hypothetical protein
MQYILLKLTYKSSPNFSMVTSAISTVIKVINAFMSFGIRQYIHHLTE